MERIQSYERVGCMITIIKQNSNNNKIYIYISGKWSMISHKSYRRIMSKFDYIYSYGVFDYLWRTEYDSTI